MIAKPAQPTAQPTALIAEDDCLHAMAYLPDASVDLVLCDLPYGTTQNAWDSVIPLDALWAQYQRVVRPGGTLVLTSQGLFTARLMLSNEAEFKYKIVWVKSKATNFLNAKKQPLRKHEDICVFVRKGGTPTYNPQMQPGEPYDKGVRKAQQTGSYGEFDPVRVKNDDGERYPTDVVYFPTAESEGPVWHSTQKPVALGRTLVRTYSNPGDVVLDNACGSGSFCLAAALEGRETIGIEQNLDVTAFRRDTLDMVAIAAERLRAAGPVQVARRSTLTHPIYPPPPTMSAT